eukprot:3039947-Amphidinium_carterae.3
MHTEQHTELLKLIREASLHRPPSRRHRAYTSVQINYGEDTPRTTCIAPTLSPPAILKEDDFGWSVTMVIH